MLQIYNKDLVLEPSVDIDPAKWDEIKYDAFVDELCRGREYQKKAIFSALRFLMSGNYQNLRELARENYEARQKLQDAYGSWEAMEMRLQLPDMLSCSLDLATGTGKSYVIYGLAMIMLAEGVVSRVLTLCPSLTIESGLINKFRALAANKDLRAALPEDAMFSAPRVINATETVTEGCICVENYHAVLKHVGSSIRSSFAGNGRRTLVLNDEAHHVAASHSEIRKWKEFLLNSEFGFYRVVGVSGTCYVSNDYFTDVVYRYSLRDAIEERFVKNVEYIAESPQTADSDERWQLIHHRHQKNARSLRSRHIRPLTIIVTKMIKACEAVAEDLCSFLCEQEDITEEQAKDKVLVITSATKHKYNVSQLAMVDSPQSKTEWIISVSMLAEGWDVKNVFQIVPHEERAFNSKLLIAQVLGRGLRVPESWTGEQPLLSIFNHDAWSGRIKHLVNEILDIEQRISSVIIPDSPHHFDLYHLEYERPADEMEYHMKGEYNLFEDGYVDLPTVQAEETVTIEYDRIRGEHYTETTTLRHKSFTVMEIAKHMHEHLLAVDKENENDSDLCTNYGKKYLLGFLENVVQESIRRANIDENNIPEEIRQRLLNGMNVLKRQKSKRITYNIEAKRIIEMNTRERQSVSCSAAELLSGGKKTIFYSSNCEQYVLEDQKEFFNTLTDKDGDFAGCVEKILNSYHFKTPVNLVIADHNPERRFVRELCAAQTAATLHGWIKNSDMGFYTIEYAWSKERSRRISHIKRGVFSPDFFLMQDSRIIIVEIKDDTEANDPSRENIAKYKFSVEHFERLNRWLESEDVEYQFNMLTPRDYPVFFDRLRGRKLKGYRSHLDVAISSIIREDVKMPEFEELDIVKITTDAYKKDGLKTGEQGTIVLVHKKGDRRAYEVEFSNWYEQFPVKVKTLGGHEIEMVKKWLK